MKAVTLDAFRMQSTGNGEAANEIVLGGMEGGVEGGRLDKMRFQMRQRADETQRCG